MAFDDAEDLDLEEDEEMSGEGEGAEGTAAQEKRLCFWEKFLSGAASRTGLLGGKKTRRKPYIVTSAGIRGFRYSFRITSHDMKIALVIVRGQGDASINTATLQRLQEFQSEIESAYGHTLRWDSMDGHRKCRILDVIEVGGLDDDQDWDAVVSETLSRLLQLDAAVRPYLQEIDSDDG